MSEVQKNQIEELGRVNTNRQLVMAIKKNIRPLHPFLQEYLETKRMISDEYGLLAKELNKAGFKTEAQAISRLRQEVMHTHTKTRAQACFDGFLGIVKEQELNR